MYNSKILTISVAAYNVERYIRQNLESITKSKYIDEIEVFVVDDGGKDQTLTIAGEYKEKYPDSINLVHKENGGYGTTVNYSVENASGEYIKLLDGDDYFDTSGLDHLIEKLKEFHADWYVTKVDKVDSTDGSSLGYDNQWIDLSGKLMEIDDVPPTFLVGMWETTYKTSLVKQSIRKFPEHTLYTDMLFVVYPLPLVKTVYFADELVYCYRVGRDEQSVSRKSRIKHCEEMISLVDVIKQYYYEINGNELAPIIKRRILSYYKWQVLNLMLLPASRKTLNRIKAIEKNAKANEIEFYDAGTDSRNIKLLRITFYMAYWPLVWYGIKTF